MQVLKSLFVVLFFILSISSAQSASIVISENPVTWKLENYAGAGVVAWYTSSSCSSGNISFASTATEADKNRFFAIVSLAKVSNRKVFVYYDNANSPTNCLIISFGLDAGQ